MPERKKTVFLIEDDTFMQEIIQGELQSHGYIVVETGDGEEALSILAVEDKASAFDIILLDLLLPKMHGFEILKRIKTTKYLAKVPVLILSNLGDRREIEEGLALGAVDYLIKTNYTPNEIVRRVGEIVKAYPTAGAFK
jgi:DNA-binding response OmpR family regulator